MGRLQFEWSDEGQGRPCWAYLVHPAVRAYWWGIGIPAVLAIMAASIGTVVNRYSEVYNNGALWRQGCFEAWFAVAWGIGLIAMAFQKVEYDYPGKVREWRDRFPKTGKTP